MRKHLFQPAHLTSSRCSYYDKGTLLCTADRLDGIHEMPEPARFHGAFMTEVRVKTGGPTGVHYCNIGWQYEEVTDRNPDAWYSAWFRPNLGTAWQRAPRLDCPSAEYVATNVLFFLVGRFDEEDLKGFKLDFK